MTNRKQTDDWLVDQFHRLQQTPPRHSPAEKKIAIISTPRCGSTFFCESLAGTGRFGDPSEWLNIRRMQAYARLFKLKDINLPNYLGYVIARTTTGNGVFSLNFHVDQYIFWQKKGFDLFSIGFDRVIYLYRRDKLAQAYSYAKALATDQWRSNFEPRRKVAASAITNPMIIKALHMMSSWDEYYDLHLSGHVHSRYCYEDVAADPSAHFHAALAECGVEHQDIATFDSGIEVQRSGQDQARLQELRAYLGCETRRAEGR